MMEIKKKRQQIKNPINKRIFEIITESNEKDKNKILHNLSNVENQEMQAQISEIMVSDYEINSVSKCIEDVIITYTKERLNERKLTILKELENPNLDNEKSKILESELSNIIIELAKIK